MVEFFVTVMVDLVNVTVQPSLQSWPTEMRLLWRLGKSEVLVACGFRCRGRTVSDLDGWLEYNLC